MASTAPGWTRWTSGAYAPRQQFDAWTAALNASHLEWSVVRGPPSPRFSAEVEVREVGALRVVRCACEPFSGSRRDPELARSDEAYFGLLLLEAGRERVRSRASDSVLDAGQLLLWDSTRPVEFELLGPLRKTTLLVPQRALRARLPGVDRFVGRSIDWRSGVGALAASHLEALATHAPPVGTRHGESLADATLELLATCLEATGGAPVERSSAGLLQAIKATIDRRLDDPELDPAGIAERHGISVRYLHLLFGREGITVSRWILQQRLERCRRDLERSGPRIRVTDVA